MTESIAQETHSLRRTLLHLFSGSSVQALASLLAGLAATRLMSPDNRGVMVVAVTVAGVAALVGSLSTGTGLRALLPTVDALERRELIRAYGWVSIGGSLLAAVLAPIACAASATVIDRRLDSTGVLIGVAAVAGASAFAPQVGEAFFAIGGFKAAAVTGAASAAGGFIAILIAATGGRGSGLLLGAQGIGTLVPAIIACRWLARSKMIDLSWPTLRAVRRLLSVGTPALGLTLGVNVVLRGDRYLLGVYEDTATVAVYALAATLSESFRVIPIGLGQVLYRKVSLRDGTKIERSLFLVPFLATCVAAGAVALAGWLFIVPIFGSAFSGARTLLLVLVLAEIAFAPFFIAAGGLFGGGWTRIAGLLGSIGGGLTLTLYAVGVAAFGSWGAAVASLLAYTGMSVAAVLLLRRRLAPAAPTTPTATSDEPAPRRPLPRRPHPG